MQVRSETKFEMLPTEILENIFENLNFTDLNNAILASRRFRSVGENPKFWRKIQLEVGATDFEIVMKIPRLSQIENLVLRTSTVVKTKITFNFDTINEGCFVLSS